MLERAREDIKAVRLQLHASEAKAQNAEQLERENRRLRDERSRQKTAAVRLEERLFKVRLPNVSDVILCNILADPYKAVVALMVSRSCQAKFGQRFIKLTTRPRRPLRSRAPVCIKNSSQSCKCSEFLNLFALVLCSHLVHRLGFGSEATTSHTASRLCRP
jgi:hypothetical protein